MSDPQRPPPVRLSNWAKLTLSLVVFLQVISLIYIAQVYDFVRSIEQAFQGFQP